MSYRSIFDRLLSELIYTEALVWTSFGEITLARYIARLVDAHAGHLHRKQKADSAVHRSQAAKQIY